jgi:hypothetical protein
MDPYSAYNREGGTIFEAVCGHEKSRLFLS